MKRGLLSLLFFWLAVCAVLGLLLSHYLTQTVQRVSETLNG